MHALSASNAWAVGEYFDGSIDKTLIVHWDGSAWTQVPSPNVSGATQNVLKAVRGSSATNVWAVGYFVNSNNADKTLTLHWNGTSWKQVASPDPSCRPWTRSSPAGQAIAQNRGRSVST